MLVFEFVLGSKGFGLLIVEIHKWKYETKWNLLPLILVWVVNCDSHCMKSFARVTCVDDDELELHTSYFCLMIVHLEIVMTLDPPWCCLGMVKHSSLPWWIMELMVLVRFTFIIATYCLVEWWWWHALWCFDMMVFIYLDQLLGTSSLLHGIDPRWLVWYGGKIWIVL